MLFYVSSVLGSFILLFFSFIFFRSSVRLFYWLHVLLVSCQLLDVMWDALRRLGLSASTAFHRSLCLISELPPLSLFICFVASGSCCFCLSKKNRNSPDTLSISVFDLGVFFYNICCVWFFYISPHITPHPPCYYEQTLLYRCCFIFFLVLKHLLSFYFFIFQLFLSHKSQVCHLADEQNLFRSSHQPLHPPLLQPLLWAPPPEQPAQREFNPP